VSDILKKIGIYSFCCCEGCSILFFEILNKKFFEWKDKIEISDSKTIGKSYNNAIDIALVEGAISTKEEEEKLKEIRKRSRIVVAIGNCATIGAPSNMRNFFDDKQKEEIKKIIENFEYLEKVKSIKEVIKVDYEVYGCPMDEKKFLEVFEKLVKQ